MLLCSAFILLGKKYSKLRKVLHCNDFTEVTLVLTIQASIFRSLQHYLTEPSLNPTSIIDSSTTICTSSCMAKTCHWYTRKLSLHPLSCCYWCTLWDAWHTLLTHSFTLSWLSSSLFQFLKKSNVRVTREHVPSPTTTTTNQRNQLKKSWAAHALRVRVYTHATFARTLVAHARCSQSRPVRALKLRRNALFLNRAVIKLLMSKNFVILRKNLTKRIRKRYCYHCDPRIDAEINNAALHGLT